eukprot:TRINITY_DN4474_c0_g1_i1.p1 TRINITY_DN4474_c0_g1~~TRINITY_DN4474_c0_g1_i1.p1  ORF type:complete len:250 (+),score=73.45 TRINITY_DN4474_c0_g1_i1:637-1386(+)
MLDKVAKATAAAPVGVLGATMWLVGAGVSGVGKISGSKHVASVGGSLCSAGASAVGTSQTLAQEAIGISDNEERNKVLQLFNKYSDGKSYLDSRDVQCMVQDMPELYFGLEGIIGTLAEIQETATKLLLKEYGQAGATINWDGFWDMWKKVLDSSQGRMDFYHSQIFTRFDTEGRGSLSMAQVSLLLDTLYFNKSSAFAGDSRIPDKSIIMASLVDECLDGDEEGRLTQRDLSPILRGEFCATSCPEDK